MDEVILNLFYVSFITIYQKKYAKKGFYRQSSSKFTLLDAKLKQQKHITYTLLIYFSLKFIFLYLLNAIELDKLIYAMRCYLLFSRMFSILKIYKILNL